MTTRTTRFSEIPGLPGVTVVRHEGATPTGARHRHDSLCVGAVLSGERGVEQDGVLACAGPGEVLVIAPGRVHACPDRGGSRSVTVSIPPALLAGLGWELPPLPGPVADDPVLFGRVLALAELAEAPSPALEREAALLALLDALAAAAPGGDIEAGPEPEPDHVAAARRRIEERFADDLRLQDLARLAGCSPCRLNRAFARAVGMPPHEYQTALRVGEVKRLIRAGQGLAEAALAAGFFDQSHMARCFRRVMGMTPGTYARGLDRIGRE